MTALVLVAASGLAREVLAAERLRDHYDSVVLADDDPARHGTEVDGVPVVGGLDEVAALIGHEVLLCPGHGRSRRSIVARLADLGVGSERFATFVHPQVHVPPGCEVGAGSILLDGVVLTAGVTVGAHVVAMPHVTLTHDDVVADYATLAAGVALGGNVTVGEAAYLGMNASVREGTRIGREATLGMGSALLADVPDGETWAGVPARRLATPRPEEAPAAMKEKS